MIGNRFYTWFKNYYQWVGGAFSETLLLPLVRATAGLRAGAIRYDETTNTVETYDGTNWNAIPSASGFVPYTGATQDVNLGEQGLEAGYLQLDTTPTGTPVDQGTIYWDIDAETAALIMNGTVQKVGEDVFFHVQNKTGSPIPKGTAVRFAGTDGNSGKILIAPFLANGTYPSQYFMGVTSETIADGAFGKVYHFGKIRGVNTQAYNAGDILYASTSVAGGFQTTPPVAPNNIIVVAAVISKANNGTLMIRSTLGSNINNDEGVLISGAANGQGLFYENGLWKNKTIATVLGYTPGTVSSVGIVTGSAGTDINVSGSPVTVSGNITFNIPTASATNRGALSSTDWTTFNNKVSTTRQLTINGTAFDLSADRTWSVGTVTSVAASAPLSVSGSATTTPVITISQANSTTNGFLSSTDWTTFNNKQNALTLTTTGNSGASTLIGATLNVPEYTISGLGGVPTTRTLTINGTAFDLSANRSWSVGTVTSVGLTSATSGVTITDSPVTVSGTIGIAIATANGSQQGLLSSTDWTTFNNKQATLSLTTSGTSGAATLIGATLNVPQYQAQGNYITSLTGEATASGPGAASVTLSTTAVTGKLLTGLNLSGGGTIAATDSILQAFGKVQNQISAMVGGVMYQGTWNASTNTPTLTSSVGVKGYYYIVDVSGTTNLNGITDWRVGDWAIFNGSTWDKVDNTDAVSSVNGFTGAVSLTTSHIAEGTNLYYLDSRSRTAISLTTTGNSGAATYDNVSGIINVPQYTIAGLGGVPTTRQLTINGTAFDLSADRSWSVGTVTSVGLNSTTSGVTITNTPVTSSGALTINIATASGSQNGLLSSTDWTTFNNKQNALTNPVTGTGVSGQLAYFNGTSTITGESNLFWNESTNCLGIRTNTPTFALEVNGNGYFADNVFVANGAELRFAANAINIKPVLVSSVWSDLAFTTNSVERMRITSGGNVGIGVTPSARLHISSNAASPSLIINNASSGWSFSQWEFNSTPYGYIGQSNSTFSGGSATDFGIRAENNLTFGVGSNERMRLTSSGNLGLGVTPSAWGSGRTVLQLGNDNSYVVGSRNTVIGNNAYNDGSNWRYLTSSVNAHIYAQLEGGSHAWYTAPSGTAGNAISFTQAMTLDASGRLGIGTTSINKRLEVAGSGVFSGTGYDGTSAEIQLNNTTASTGRNFVLNSFNGGGFQVADKTAGGQTRFLIDASGNVGIGTTSPVTRLTVNGGSANTSTNYQFKNISVTSGFSSGYANTAIQSLLAGYDGNSIYGTDIGYGYDGTGYALMFSTNDNTSGDPIERMRITSGGNVGIGTASPGSRLEVFSSTGAAAFGNGINILTNPGTFTTGHGGILQFQNEDVITAGIRGVRDPGSWASSLLFYTHTSDVGNTFNTTFTEKMRITSGGDVGIGTTSPVYRMHIVNSGNTLLQLNGNNTAGTLDTGFTISADDSKNIYLYQRENAATIFGTNNTERMRIHSNGGLKFNPQSAAPTAEAGTVYYDSDDNKLKVYNGTSWVDLH